MKGSSGDYLSSRFSLFCRSPQTTMRVLNLYKEPSLWFWLCWGQDLEYTSHLVVKCQWWKCWIWGERWTLCHMPCSMHHEWDFEDLAGAGRGRLKDRSITARWIASSRGISSASNNQLQVWAYICTFKPVLSRLVDVKRNTSRSLVGTLRTRECVFNY